MAEKRLSGKRSTVVLEQDETRYENCPDWVPGAVDRCVRSGLVPRPVVIIWHLRQTSTRWGTCWPEQGRVHVYPWSGLRQEIDDDVEVDVSGEVVDTSIASRIVAGAQDAADIEDTLAHELAHLVHRKHDAQHAVLTVRLVKLVKAQ